MKIFISSSSESKHIAEYVCEALGKVKGVTPKPWYYPDVFTPGISFLDVLHDIKQEVTGAIIVFSEDDKTYSRGNDFSSVRDNILIEYGLFSSELGREEVLVLVYGNPKIPLNLWGMNTIEVEKDININNFRALYDRRISDWCKKLFSSNKIKLATVELQKEVFAYVFNRLNPYQDISLTRDFLKDLPNVSTMSSMSEVLFPLDRLMHNYVTQFIEEWMRVYFVFKLSDTKVIDGIDHLYRIGISYSKNEEHWLEGNYVVEASNVDKVYRSGSLSRIKDATRIRNTKNEKNYVVKNEGSVVAFPVLFMEGSNVDTIGVVGISSPNKEEVCSMKYENLIQELSIIFSSLFYSYGQMLLNEKSFNEVVSHLRTEIEQEYPD